MNNPTHAKPMGAQNVSEPLDPPNIQTALIIGSCGPCGHTPGRQFPTGTADGGRLHPSCRGAAMWSTERPWHLPDTPGGHSTRRQFPTGSADRGQNLEVQLWTHAWSALRHGNCRRTLRSRTADQGTRRVEAHLVGSCQRQVPTRSALSVGRCPQDLPTRGVSNGHALGRQFPTATADQGHAQWTHPWSAVANGICRPNWSADHNAICRPGSPA